MKAIALVIAVLMVSLGLTGVLWPEGLIPLAVYSVTANGLYVAAAVRIVLGALLFLAASATRTPKTIRAIGLIILVAGIATVLISTERAQLMKDWFPAHIDAFRIAACLPLAVGILVGLSTLTKERRS